MDEELFAFAAGLDVGVRADAPADGARRAKKTRAAKERAPRRADGPPAAASRSETLAELTAALGDDMGHADVRRRIGAIAAAVAAEDGAAARTEVVAPAPERAVQERLERSAAYDAVSRDTHKWVPIIRRNRSAPHRVFGAAAPASRATALGALLGAADAPAGAQGPPARSALASAMNTLLSAAGLASEEQQLEAERRLRDSRRGVVPLAPSADSADGDALDPQGGAAAPAAATLEDDEARVAALAKQRALVLWTEQKRRQQARIKSKSFRRHVRRELAAKAAKEDAPDAADPEDARFRAELERARERVSLKTRRAGKWAAEQLAGRRILDPRSREAAMAQVREKERLRQEIYGRAEAPGDSDDGGRAAAESSDGDDGLLDGADDGSDSVDEIFDGPADEEDAVVGRRVFNGAPQPPVPQRDAAEDAAEGAPPRRDDAPQTFEEAQRALKPAAVSDEQLRLVREAFEGDDVFASFEAHKAAVVQEEAPQTRDVTLPGWGAWAGAGTVQRTRTRVLKKDAGVAPKDRRDAGLAHVVIREGRSRRAAALTVPQAPYPYAGDAAAYAAAVAAPVGAEWTSASAFAARIRPRIRTMPGVVIDPIRYADALEDLRAAAER